MQGQSTKLTVTIFFALFLLSHFVSAEQITRNIDLPSDTTLENGYFIKYNQTSDTSYVVSWGNNSFERHLEERQFDMPGNIPRLSKHNNSVLIMKLGCGTTCWHDFILPLDTIRDVQDIWYPVVYDMGNDLVVYIGYQADTLLTVKDFFTGNAISIFGEPCDGIFFGQQIDSLAFSGKMLFLRYFDDCEQEEFQEKRKTKELKLSIDF